MYVHSTCLHVDSSIAGFFCRYVGPMSAHDSDGAGATQHRSLLRIPSMQLPVSPFLRFVLLFLDDASAHYFFSKDHAS